MLQLINSKNIISTVGLVSVVGNKTIRTILYNTYYGTVNIINFFTLYNNTYSHEKIELMDIEFKLKIITQWLKNNNETNIMYNNIVESSYMISYYFNIINKKIIYHQSKWFSNWRHLCLENEIHLLQKNVVILNERLKILKILS